FALGHDQVDLFSFLQHPLGLLYDFFTERRQCDLILAPLKNGGPQTVFELLNGEAQRRLRDKAALGGPAEMPLLPHNNDIAKLCEVNCNKNYKSIAHAQSMGPMRANAVQCPP